MTTPNEEVSDPGHLRLYDENKLHALFDGYEINVFKEDTFFYIIYDRVDNA
jgi:hypothetical protein